jgi:protein-tyrosine phosphatase
VTSSRIPLEGAYNFRDLGGLVALDGRTTAPGLVFRSDRLTRLTPADAARLEALGIGRVFDLRSDLELAEHGAGEFSEAGGRHRHRPLVKVSLSLTDARIDWAKVDLQHRYLEMLHEGAPVIREILEHLAASEAPPTVFHCTGGKDRTGVVAAVLLRALGVDDEVIVADYAISEKYLEPFVEASRAQMESEGYDPAIVLYLCGSPAERMRKMLQDLDERWKGVEGYLEWIGLRAERAESLRRRLLV